MLRRVVYVKGLVPYVTPPYHISVVLPLRAHVHGMSIDRVTLGENKGSFVMIIYTPIRPYIYVHRGSISTYIPGVMLCVGIFAHTTDDRHQTICGRHNASYVCNPAAQQ